VLDLRPDQPFDGGRAPGGDALFVLPAGNYRVSAIALGLDGAPNRRCARAATTAAVFARMTSEVELAILCDGKDTGGLDVVVTVHDAPVITKLTLDPGKFISTCTKVSMEVTAVVDPPGPLTYAWTISAAPAGSTPVLDASGSHATFLTTTPGDYEITVTVTAASGLSTSLTFPLHVSGPAVDKCGPHECAPEESCFNRTDDDCDGLADCADPDCNRDAVCVPDPAGGGFALGVTVGAGEPCPPGFASPEVINTGLSAGSSCGGCSCGAGTTVCGLKRIDYVGPDQRANCMANNGVAVGPPILGGSLTISSGMSHGGCEPAGGGTTGGFFSSTRFADAFDVTMSCGAPAGSPLLPAATWASTRTFCVASGAGGGCGAGQRCVPRAPAPAARCVLATGAAICPAGYGATGAVYTGFADARTCSACSCGGPTGGSCDGVHLQQSFICSASDASFIDKPLGLGDCGDEFSYRLGGSATPPMCAAASPILGAATPTGLHTLCCL
jgi:hypothetical protein